MKYIPYQYQSHATEHVLENPASGLFLEMGLGKTVATLTAIDKLIYDDFEISKVLVIAPKRVAENVWTTEAEKWDHLRHLKFSLVLGDEVKRKKALKAKADIYVINRENVAWLIAHYGGAFPFDMLVIDELSSFKSAKSARFKALRQVRPKVDRVVGLTGTPAPNGLLDLWSQVYLLDQGQRLGETLTGFRTKYFSKDPYKPFAKYEVMKNDSVDLELIGEDYYEKRIYEKIGDICISMKSDDYLELPERVDRMIDVKLNSKIYSQYLEFEKEQVLSLENIDDISPVNAAGLTNKLLQYANGAVYDSEGQWHEVHNEKIEALEELLDVANGKPFFVFYSFKHDLERIMKHLKKFKPRQLKSSADINDWNKGSVSFMIAHPGSAGHGLNLQAGGHNLCWFSSPWSLELYQQGVTRFHRQGQKERVLNNRLIARGTMDENVVAALDKKTGSQEALMQAVKAIVKKYKN